MNTTNIASSSPFCLGLLFFLHMTSRNGGVHQESWTQIAQWNNATFPEPMMSCNHRLGSCFHTLLWQICSMFHDHIWMSSVFLLMVSWTPFVKPSKGVPTSSISISTMKHLIIPDVPPFFAHVQFWIPSCPSQWGWAPMFAVQIPVALMDVPW